MESTPFPDQASQGLYSKANIRQSKSISLTRPYISSRTRQRALSTASAFPDSPGQSYNLNPASPSSRSDLGTSDPLSPQSSSSSKSKPRKRLSLNFALPVLPDGVSTTPRRSISHGTSNTASATSTPATGSGACNGGSANSNPSTAAYHHSATPSTSSISSIHTSSSISGSTGYHHTKAQSFSHVLTSPRHHQLSNTVSPSTSPKHKQSASVSHTRAHLKNVSTDSTASCGSDSSTFETPDTVEFFFSQLAFKERRVVELKDEIQRLQMLLKQAESEFQYYYNCAEQKLRNVIPNTPMSEEPSKPAPVAVSATESSASVKSRRMSRIHSPFTFMDNLNEPRRQHKKSASSVSSVATSRHSNSLSDSSQSSVETVAEPLQEKVSLDAPNNDAGSTTSGNYQMSHQQAVDSLYQPASANRQQKVQDEEESGDFLNKGRRVVEELGTQFWSLFEDIKNVAIGEEARDTGYSPEHHRRRSSGRHNAGPPNHHHHHYGTNNAMIVEEEPEVIVTGVSTNVQRRATVNTGYSGSALRNSSSMQNLRRASQGGVVDVMNSSSKHLRSVPEAAVSTASSSNSYFVV